MRFRFLAPALLLTVTGAWAQEPRPPLKDVSAIRISNYGAPSRLLEARSQVAPLVAELNQLRRKAWHQRDSKISCYATVVLMHGKRQVALFRVTPLLVVERPVEQGALAYSIEVSPEDLPKIFRLLTEIPAGKACM